MGHPQTEIRRARQVWPDSHNDPNKWGSDVLWEEQERFTNDSLYANHDWDIFKVG